MLETAVAQVDGLPVRNLRERTGRHGVGEPATISQREGGPLPSPATVHCVARDVARTESLLVVVVEEPVPNAGQCGRPSVGAVRAVALMRVGLLLRGEAVVDDSPGVPGYRERVVSELAHAPPEVRTNKVVGPTPVTTPVRVPALLEELELAPR